MIAVDKRGRLGNQMFQYAFGAAVAKRLRTRQAYDTSELERYFTLLESPRVMATTRRLIRAYDRVFGLRTREVDADERENPGEVLMSATNNTSYGGHFYSERFFRPAADAVRRAFAIREEHLDRFRAKYASLLEGGYVAAHVRLTDFFTYRDDITLPPGYYRRALAALAVDLPVVVVSDEPDRVRRAFDSDPRFRVEANDEILDFQLLRHATHVISSNSSFAWWAAWLNDNPDLRVIAPRWWLGMRAGYEIPVEVIPGDWEQIEPRCPEDGEWPLV
jgi:Glycosyl transferase family 11